MKIGFIGLGNLGEHLAINLVRAGFTVTVHDLNPKAAAGLIEAGAAWADSPSRPRKRQTPSSPACPPRLPLRTL
jgi:3-hydroxyisobutyrate dehydrogenase-like beta-hydroxyacid dehydrogenase